jgi:hypothetical protein
MIRSQSLLLLLLLTAASKRTPRRNHHRRHTLPNKSPPGITIHPSLEPTARAFIDDNGRTNGGERIILFLSFYCCVILLLFYAVVFLFFQNYPTQPKARGRDIAYWDLKRQRQTPVCYFFSAAITLPYLFIVCYHCDRNVLIPLLPCLCDFARFKLPISGLGWELETRSRDWRSGARVTQSRVVISLMYQGTRG